MPGNARQAPRTTRAVFRQYLRLSVQSFLGIPLMDKI